MVSIEAAKLRTGTATNTEMQHKELCNVETGLEYMAISVFATLQSQHNHFTKAFYML